MTVASEITRLQNAKSSIKTSIENKGVTVGSSLKLDGYAACIDAIPTGSSDCFIEALVVAGGGGGGMYCGGGGGGGGVAYGEQLKVTSNTLTVTVGARGNGGEDAPRTPSNGGDSCISCVKYDHQGCMRAYGGGAGGNGQNAGCPGGSGGGGGAMNGSHCFLQGGCTYFNQGNKGGDGIYFRNTYTCNGGGGGGYMSSGCPSGSAACTLSTGGVGDTWTRGYTFDYAGGGGGGGATYNYLGAGKCGGGNGSNGCGGNATSYGGGGGGGGPSGKGGYGYQGVVIIRWPADGSYGFTTATGGNCCNCVNGWCTRMFTSSGTFTITG